MITSTVSSQVDLPEVAPTRRAALQWVLGCPLARR
jgi:hypothetical protein